MTSNEGPIQDPDQFLTLAPADRQYVVLGMPPGTPVWRWLFTPTAVYEGARRLVVAHGAPPIVPISGHVAEQLHFSTGLPHPGHVYRSHPQSPEEYLPVASFHPTVLRDKFEEALAICMRLGATSVEARFQTGNEVAFRPTIKLPQAPGVPIEVALKGGTGSTYEFKAGFRTGRPSLPESTRWLATEPSWEALVDAAFEERLTDFRLSVEVQTDFGLSTAAARGLQAGNLNLGGSFSAFKATSYVLDVRFD